MTALIWIPLLRAGRRSAPAAWWRRTDSWTRAADLAVAAVAVLAAGTAPAGHGARRRARGRRPAGVLRADALSAWLLTTIGAVAVTALWGGLPTKAAQRRPGRPLHRTDLPVPGRDEPGGPHRQPGHLVGRHRGHHHRHRLPGRPPPQPADLSRPPGSTSSSARSASRSPSSASSCSTPPRSRRGPRPCPGVQLASGGLALDPDLTRIAVALAVLGFATKAGLAPMHSWLPDAHSQAPAPVSGLMSGVLLSVALYAILRVQAIGDAVLGPQFLRGLLLAGGLLSLAVAAAHDPGPTRLQADAGLLQHRAHGDHGARRGRRRAAGHRRGPAAHARPRPGQGRHVRRRRADPRHRGQHPNRSTSPACSTRRPDLARPLLAGTAALLGFPPFVLFFTEVAIVVAGWQAGLGWAMGIALVLLLVVFAGLSRHVSAMTLGAPAGAPAPGPGGQDQPSGRAPGPAAHDPPRALPHAGIDLTDRHPSCSRSAQPPSWDSWPSPSRPSSARPHPCWRVPDDTIAAPPPGRAWAGISSPPWRASCSTTAGGWR